MDMEVVVAAKGEGEGVSCRGRDGWCGWGGD